MIPTATSSNATKAPSPDDLAVEIRECLAVDRVRLSRRLKRSQKPGKEATGEDLFQLASDVKQARLRREEKLSRVPEIDYPAQLPITAMIDEIAATIRSHTVTVICGETGSGKSTQLPKVCVQLGLGRDAVIGHTQPRRIAARTIANRLADETGVEPGQEVGYKIRHTDHTSHRTWIKVMTDGVLLAELQQDRSLGAYDAIIIDEAHERSLNIDFLLGYLKQLSRQRPDLRIIITSATIDVERFSEHFDNAPVIEVSGRSYPVEIRYRPIEEDGEDDEIVRGQALLGAVQELGRESHGDILVFLDGERGIRDMQKFLQKQKLPNTDILPLYSRLAARQQSRIFSPHNKRHVILSTNVAETSLTIDGIKYVIDFGLARISRYSYRSKVQRLPIEKIARASANQRSGRCGRMSDGVCIRLYSAEDFESRAEFTDPEILRTNLASVILQMKALRIGDIEDFDFIDPPNRRYINDGMRLLDELGALDSHRHKLTRTGRDMARLPLEPRLARIILAAKQWDCLAEILVIASGLSIQDPRERPLEQQEQADKAHAVFMDADSDFLWFLRFWQFYREQSRKLSRNRLQKLCKQNFVSAARMHEWQDIHAQLSVICREMGMRQNTEPAHFNNIHSALLTGLSSHVAQKSGEHDYSGARGTGLNIFPGSGLFQSRPKWVMAYELVETSKLYARTVARIDPKWLLKTSGHLLQSDYSGPRWDHNRQQVLVTEKVSMYGLIIVPGRSVPYARVDQSECRKLFIREALVHQGLNSRAAFYQHNRTVIEEIRQLEVKQRRMDVLDEEALYAFYDQRLPEDVCGPDSLGRWRRQAEKENPRILFLDKSDIMRHEADTVTPQNYPGQIHFNTLELPVDYRFSPGDEADGVNVDVPVYALNQLSEQSFDRLVPALLEEKITALLKSLPGSLRKQLVPVPDTAHEIHAALQDSQQALRGFLSEFLFRRYGIEVSPDEWDMHSLPDHLKINIRVVDESGQCLAQGRDLEALQDRFSEHATRAFTVPDQHQINRDNLTDWDFDVLPESVTIDINGTRLPAYPALVDCGDSVSITTFDTQARATYENRHGLRRLLMIRLARDIRYLRKNLPGISRIRLLYAPTGDADALVNDLVELIIDETFMLATNTPRNRAAFDALVAGYGGGLVNIGNKIAGMLHDALLGYQQVRTAIGRLDDFHSETVADIEQQLDDLVYDGFLQETPVGWLEQYPRYFAAINKRIERLDFSKSRDPDRAGQVQKFEAIYYDLYNRIDHEYGNVELDELRWMLQEFRVSLFAQELKTVIPVSARRIQNQIEKIRNG